MEKKIIKLPFDGFYESVSNAMLDGALKQVFSDENGHEHEIPDNFYDRIDWCKAHEAYARNYCESLAEYLDRQYDLKISFKFESLQSPKYYNFETDKIFAYISQDEIKKLYDEL